MGRYARRPSSPNYMDAYNHDPLVPVHEWPGTVAGYAFLAGSSGSATLRLEVAFDPAQARQAPAALAYYELVQGQLTDPRTTLSVTTAPAAGPVSPATTGGDDLAAALVELVGAIVASLDPAAPNSPPPAPVVLTAAVPVSHVAQIPEHLFPVWVAIETRREASEAIYPSDYLSVTSSASPWPSASRDWALGFETAFGGSLKLLASDSPVPGYVWALKWGTGQGVSVSFANARGEEAGAPAYFARRPLSTRLVAGDAEIHAYQDDGTPVAQPARASFTGIDLDVWGSAFLKSFERLLAPELAAAIAELDGDSYAALIEARADLADAIASSVAPVFEDGSLGAGELEAARAHLRDGLLASLETDLAVAAIAQLPATVTTPSGADNRAHPAELVGTPSATGSRAATLPIADGTWELTFLVAPGDPAETGRLRLAPDLHLSGVDHGKQARSSSRLGFLVSDAALAVPMGELDIPVPLRGYPSPPRLVEQSIAAAHDPPASLTRSVEASYTLTLASPSAAQDDVHLSLLFNGAALDRSEPGPAPDAPLLAPLARFNDFQERYGETAVAAIEAGAASAKQWLRDIVALARDVAAAWRGESQGESSDPVTGPAPAGSPAPFTWDFVLRVPDRRRPNELLLRWNGTGTAPDASWPAIEGAGGTPAPGGARAYTLGATANVAKPRLVWPDLSVVTNQRISAAAWIVRNESLAGWSDSQRTTDPSLVYRGPATSFEGPAVPRLEVPGGLTIQSTSLTDGVSQLVTQVLQPSAPDAQVGFGVDVRYSFATGPGEEQPRTELPVFRGRGEVTTAASPPPGVETPQQLATGIEEALATWHRELGPSDEDAAVLFSVTLFAAGGDHPLARLPDVELPVSQPGWWPA